jgi:hypothetical protein
MRFVRRSILCLPVLFICGLAAQQTPSQPSAAAPAPGEITNGIYKNRFFGLSYRIRYGWVDRTDEMREASNEPAKATVLLAIFERPPLATGNTVNSSVVIAAESVSSYPGLKKAAQYFGPVSEVTQANGLKPVN